MTLSKTLLTGLVLVTSFSMLPYGVFAEMKKTPSTSQVVLKAKAQAELSSQLSGKIADVPLAEGDSFKKNQPLVVFDCTVQQAQLEQAKVTRRAKKSLYDAQQRMHKAKAVSDVELADSQAELAKAQAELTIKQHTVDLCQIKAPFAGRLVKRHVYPHETVRQGQVLVEVLDNQNLDIELIVPSSWLAWLQAGEPFTLFVEETGDSYRAHVTRVLPQVDAVSQSVRLLGKLDQQNEKLISGMSGRATFHQRRIVNSSYDQ